mmetsp:Transcript_43084/g.100381  ORF Transcript_43084/g.100381 Transcript_43084/m.100381 type:complete len:222 (-) Transcript_43084:292-957(-)
MARPLDNGGGEVASRKAAGTATCGDCAAVCFEGEAEFGEEELLPTCKLRGSTSGLCAVGVDLTQRAIGRSATSSTSSFTAWCRILCLVRGEASTHALRSWRVTQEVLRASKPFCGRSFGRTGMRPGGEQIDSSEECMEGVSSRLVAAQSTSTPFFAAPRWSLGTTGRPTGAGPAPATSASLCAIMSAFSGEGGNISGGREGGVGNTGAGSPAPWKATRKFS